ncbi:unnamed protein product [Allacma fusca]|uniref:Coiled-coil domain-containing protein 43 n=1 Tax=Allacma fusca TaxID=39272 RepID=A0A8J2P288_9HEXA|nr:unnamed protein product [Allacma fusca]
MAEVEDFDTWLNDRLRDLKTDETVFGPYIKSILEGDEDFEERIEALDGLLVELQANLDVNTLREEILERWNQAQSLAKAPKSGGASSSTGIDFFSSSAPTSSGQLKSDCNGTSADESLANQMDTFMKLAGLDGSESSSSKTTTSSRDRGDIGADSALRAAILSQYCANESSSEEDEEGAPKASKAKGPLEGISKNDNVEKVLAENREHKEKARADHAKKKERDKEDRAKQKQAAQERKDKAKKKATKGERKR